MSSILNDVKHVLGVPAHVSAFDNDLVMHINSVFTILTQLNVGPAGGYEITGDANQWSEFTSDVKLNAVKSYVFLRVRLMFDPPNSGFVLSSMTEQIKELEFRLNVVADYG